METKIKELQEKAQTDMVQTKEKSKKNEELLQSGLLRSELDTMKRRYETALSEKTSLESKIKDILNKKKFEIQQAIDESKQTTATEYSEEAIGLRAKIANYNKREREYLNNKVLQDKSIVELRKEFDILKEKVKSTNEEQISSSMAKISEIISQCDLLYEKRITDEDRARRQLLANERIAQGAEQIHDVTIQIGENKETAKINELEDIKRQLKTYLDTPDGITKETLNSIFEKLQGN